MSPSVWQLHVWPSRWALPSFDPACLAAVILLQLTVPGNFTVAECNNPDLSPTGQLPFLTCEQHTVAGFSSIAKYIADRKPSGGPRSTVGNLLDRSEKSKIVAWNAHVESRLGDILYYLLYSHLDNWVNLTHPTLVSMFPVPQRYYVPGRIRESYRPRLETAGLWNVQVAIKEEKKPFREPTNQNVDGKEENKRKFHEAFEREKVLEKARSSFDMYSRLLGDKDVFFGEQPTTLDVLFAAHLLLLLEPKYPDSSVQTLLKESYPSLIIHSRRVYEIAFGPSSPPLQIATAEAMQWRSLIPWPSTRPKQEAVKKSESELEEDAHDSRMRWGFLGLAIGSMAVYLVVAFNQAVQIVEARREGLETEYKESNNEATAKVV